jgi:AraC-like DNA-binding protein
MKKQGALATQQSDELSIAKQGLLARVSRWASQCGTLETAIPDLSLVRREGPTELASYIHEPSVCLVAQGRKQVLLGREKYPYDANHYLITALDMPVMAQVLEASPERPYFGLVLKIDKRIISQLMVDSELPALPSSQSGRAMRVSEVTLPLLSALLRLIDLLDEPESIPVLAPLIEREILYRLLVSEQGPQLRQIGSAASQGYQIARAIDWLKKNFSRSLSVEELAKFSHMSASTFHHHFKELTAMSPLQYQKWLRLQEARRLMLAEHLDASSAAFEVGYESPSQFSREYSRLFKAPPSRDIKAFREGAESPQGARL